MKRILGILGGSGLYDLPGLEDREEIEVDTPFGRPSDAILRGRLGHTTVLFLARHGRGHVVAPQAINYRANVFAMKKLGAEQLVSISAVGSLREAIAPGEFVIVDQYVDWSRSRATTFFGTYVCIEGPQFSTRAESHMFRQLGCDVIGMTNAPEYRLAREAELPFAALSMATDFDCWHTGHETVTVEQVLDVMQRNSSLAERTITALAKALPDPAASPASRALDAAVVTQNIPPPLVSRLSPLLDRAMRERG